MSIDSALPLVSIRIPAFNHGKFIVQTLDSVLQQGYKNIEIVIIDDASTDNTWSEICKWEQEKGGRLKFKAVRHEVNKGITTTINELVALCEGEYIAGIASDDFLLPGSIEKRVSYLENNKDKSAVFGDCIVIDAEGNEIHESGISSLYTTNVLNLLNDNTIAKELILNWGVPGGTLMTKRSVYYDITFDERLLVEDFDFFLKLLSRKKLGYLNEKLSAYRLHGANVSRNKELKVRLKRKKDYLQTILANFCSFSVKHKFYLLMSIFKRI